jgi:hypothetical protein
VLTTADLSIFGSDRMGAFEPLARTAEMAAGQPVARVAVQHPALAGASQSSQRKTLP